MLEYIRRHRKFFSIIFVVAAVGMVVSLFGTGAGGNSGGGPLFSSGVVGKVLDEKISYQEFTRTLSYRYEQSQTMLRQQLGDKANDPQMREIYEKILMAQLNPSYLLEQTLRERFNQAQARRLGYRVPDTAVRYSLEKEKFFQKDGHFDPILYRERVARPGDFEDSLRKKLLDDALQYNFTLPFSLLSQEEIRQLSLAKQTRVFEALSVDLKMMSYVPNLTEEMKQAAQKQPNFDSDLRAFFETQKSRYNQEAQVNARHILITDKEGGEKRLKEIRSEIEGKKLSFADAAKKYSQDKSNAPMGGELGFFQKKEMDPAFSEAAFALKKAGDVSGVIKSSFGYHLIELVARREAVNKTFEEVRNQLVDSYLRENLKRDYALKVLANIAAGKQSLSKADEKNLSSSWKKLQPWSPMDALIGPVSAEQLDVKQLLSLKKKGELYPKVIPQGDLLVLLKFVESKEVPANVDELRAEKAAQALDYYLDSTYQELEKKKKIYRSEKILSQLQSQLQAGQTN
jgi:parvulin-like peptidyl-prolyl isomerase